MGEVVQFSKDGQAPTDFKISLDLDTAKSADLMALLHMSHEYMRWNPELTRIDSITERVEDGHRFADIVFKQLNA